MYIVKDAVEDKPKKTVFKLESDYKLVQPSALKIAMGYRGIRQTELCKNIKGLSQSNLSKFLKGNKNTISDVNLKKIMIFLGFPFDFIYKEFKPIKTSKSII